MTYDWQSGTHLARTHPVNPAHTYGIPLARISLVSIPLVRIPLVSIPLARIPRAHIPRTRIPFARIALARKFLGLHATAGRSACRGAPGLLQA